MGSPPSAGQAGASSPPRRSRPTQGELVESVLQRAGLTLPLVDIGINLCDTSFDKDRAEVIQRAAAAGLQALVVTGSCLRTTEAAAALCDDSSHPLPLYFTAGVHPHNAKDCDDATIARLTALAAHPRCVAVGECGLDFNRNFSPPEVQERWFAAQIELAERLQLPLFMHCRDAGARFVELLGQHRRSAPGVVHCFTGTKGELEAALGAGLFVGVTGWVCDERPDRGGAALAALLPLIPDGRLLVETDGPYLTPRSIT